MTDKERKRFREDVLEILLAACSPMPLGHLGRSLESRGWKDVRDCQWWEPGRFAMCDLVEVCSGLADEGLIRWRNRVMVEAL